jgi:Flp pilus assembly protein TadG
MAAWLLRKSSSFAEDRRGTVAIIFALMSFAFLMVAGVAIDYSRVIHMNKRMMNAADAAALAAGGALLDGRLNDNEIELLAQNYFNKNMEQAGSSFGTFSEPEVTVDRAGGDIVIASVATVPMSITKIAGITEVRMPVNVATSFDQQDIELGLALDVTGSMRGTKLTDLKNAAKDLIDILMPDSGQSNRVRIGLAPYAASINAGSYAETVTGHSGGHNCVHERTGAERFTDAAPIGINMLKRRDSMSCPSATVQALTDNKSLLKSSIDSYSASGRTAGHLGASWAWYLISPAWNAIWPSSGRPVEYGTNDTTKAVILMTDGIFNQRYESTNGSSEAQARAVCADMKSKGVAVYSVAFQAPSTAQALLQDCSSGSSFYYSAENGEELRQAFTEIAKTLNNLRLTN